MYTSTIAARPVTGTYQIDPTQLDEYTLHWKITLLWRCSLVYLILVVLALQEYSDNTFFYLLVLTLGMYLPLIVYWFVLSPKNPFKHTIIEIRNQTIYRYGDGLIPTQIPLNEIGKVIVQADGMVLIRKGIWGVLGSYAPKRSMTNHLHIIYIPSTMYRYEDLKTYMQTLEDTHHAYIYV